MGILSNIKHLGPLFLYGAGIIFFLKGVAGDGRWALLLVTFLIPLRNVVDKIQDFPLGSQFIDILIAGALMGCFITHNKQNKGSWAPSNLNFIIFVLIGYMFLSLLMGNWYLHIPFTFDDRVKDWKNFCLMPLLFFITLNHITERVWIVRMLMAMAFAFFVMDYYTVDQIRDFSALVSREKISGTFQFLGPNEVAAFYSQYTIILMSVIFFIKNWRVKGALLAIICANIYCVLFLYSRGAYLGLLGGMLFLFTVKNKIFLIPLIFLMFTWNIILPQKVIERITHTENQYGQLDESTEGRLIIWHEAMDLFKRNPVFGIGFGVFRNLGLILGDTHNIYVKILVEQGLIGMLVFLIVIFRFLSMGHVLYKKGEDDLAKSMGLGLMACIIVVMINSFFGDRWSYLELSSYLWVFAGLVGRLIIMPQDPSTDVQVGPQPKTQANTVTTPKKKKKIRYYDI